MNATDLIRHFENFSATPYWDVNAYRAGYGSDTATLADGRVVPIAPGMTVTKEDAQRDLDRRVTTEFGPRAVAAVGQDVWGRMSDPQRGAIVSLTYNYGSLPASVAAAARSGDPAATAAAIQALATHNDGVNARRRSEEARVFAGGDLPAGALPSDPQARNAVPLALAYRTGKMTPEDAALYERGMSEGLFPKVDRRPEDDPASVYASIALNRPRGPVQIMPLQSAAQPLPGAPLRYPGL